MARRAPARRTIGIDRILRVFAFGKKLVALRGKKIRYCMKKGRCRTTDPVEEELEELPECLEFGNQLGLQRALRVKTQKAGEMRNLNRGGSCCQIAIQSKPRERCSSTALEFSEAVVRKRRTIFPGLVDTQVTTRISAVPLVTPLLSGLESVCG